MKPLPHHVSRCRYCNQFLRDVGDPLTRYQRLMLDFIECNQRPVSAARIAAYMRLSRPAERSSTYLQDVTNVRVQIHHIRGALGPNAIVTIPGEGYIVPKTKTAQAAE